MRISKVVEMKQLEAYKELPHLARHILLDMMIQVNDKRLYYGKQATLVENTGISMRSVTRSLLSLEERGFLSRDGKGPGGVIRFKTTSASVAAAILVAASALIASSQPEICLRFSCASASASSARRSLDSAFRQRSEQVFESVRFGVYCRPQAGLSHRRLCAPIRRLLVSGRELEPCSASGGQGGVV